MLRIVFIAVPLLILSLIAWRLWREYHRVQTIEGFTDEEKSVLKRQVVALLAFLPFLLVYVILFVIGEEFALNLLNNFFFSLFYILVGLVILGYVAWSSIINQVSILRGRGQQKPLKGWSAILSGILIVGVLMVISVVFVVGTLFD